MYNPKSMMMNMCMMCGMCFMCCMFMCKKSSGIESYGLCF